MLKLLFQAFSCVIVTCVQAQNSNDPKSLGDTYLITNAHVVTRPGVVKENHSILIRNGLIQQVGLTITPPFDAQVIKADSMYVYAGFIAPISHIGIKKEDKKGRPDVDDPGNPPNAVAGITPQNLASAAIDPNEKSIGAMRAQGFGIAHTVPNGRMLPGQGAIITLEKTKELSRLMIKDEVSLFAQLKSTTSRIYPSTTIAVISKWREMYKNAELSKAYLDKYKLNPLGMRKPVVSPEIQALIPASQKQQMVYFMGEKALDIHRVMAIHKDQEFNLVLCNTKQANQALSKLKGLKNPILLSLDLPKAIKEEKKDSTKTPDPEVLAFNKRKQESYDSYLSQAADLEKENMPFAFSYTEVKPKDIFPNLKRMIKSGMSETTALKGLTTIPADLLGISNIVGTVESGKMANLVITDKKLFEEKSTIKYVFVNGSKTKFEKQVKKKKKKSGSSDDSEEYNFAGSWKYEVEIPGQTQTGIIKIEKMDDSYTIQISNDQEPGDFDDVTNPTFDGNTVSFPYNVEDMNLVVTFDLNFDEETFEGTVSVDGFGIFPVSGSKQPK